MYKTKELAEIAGISVRALHYYDQIGLLVPSERTASGYRLYNDENMVTLQQIMLLKELGFSLKKIQELGTGNVLLAKDVLIAQKNVLLKKQARLNEIINMLTTIISERKGGNQMIKKEMFSAFDMSGIENAQKNYVDEINRRFPKELVDESNKKTNGYTKQDWQHIMQHQTDMNTQLASYLKNNVSPLDESVQKLIAQFQRHITQNFYTCNNDCLKGLGDMYVSDERFTAYYEQFAPGLAQYIQKAIQNYCNQVD